MFKNVKRISIDKLNNDAVITFERKLKTIFSKNTKALLIDINSYGPLSFSMSISNMIREFKKEKKVPVYTFGENSVMGASLIILASGDHVFSDKFTMFGFNDFSVGKFNFNKFIKNRNLEVNMIASGRHKIRLNPFKEVKPEDEDWIKNILRKQKEVMIERLKELRGNKFNAEKFLATDDFFIGDKALDLGLVDAFESLDGVLMKEFNNKKPKFVKNKLTMGDIMKMIYAPKIDFDINLEAEVFEHMVENNLKNNLL